jgi:hypothetical protein
LNWSTEQFWSATLPELAAIAEAKADPEVKAARQRRRRMRELKFDAGYRADA